MRAWVIQRKSDGKYWGRGKWVKSLDLAKPYRKRVNLTKTDVETPVEVTVTIRRVKK
jgi:hypothetical protein